MKALTFLVGAMFVVLGIRAQGVVDFTNRSIAPNVNAPIFEPDGRTLAPARSIDVQFHAGVEIDSLTPFGVPVHLGIGPDHSFPGYYDGGVLELPGISPGTTVWAQVWAWDSQVNSFAEAASQGLRHGRSNLFRLQPGEDPLNAVGLIGLESTILQIPEPSPGRLGLLALILLWTRGRWRRAGGAWERA
jgi:hypothetical protein